MDSFWIAIIPLLLKKTYRAVWYCKSTLTSSAEKIALASEETKKEKGVGLGMKNLKIQQSIPFMKMPGCWWVCSVGRSCSVSMNLGAEGESLGEMHGILGLTDNIASPGCSGKLFLWTGAILSCDIL